ncbi:hypothetical protein CSCA_2935 [Clostridium scatologenes]|uniref:DUF2975 domain-containing protein n=2 Tax=Clostridium scatologenes TaxID=1548 RepID=A0A0E3JP65_CLOSL|nr:hypothetical protein CSCA_2935 [Clostridium scatologenes]
MMRNYMEDEKKFQFINVALNVLFYVEVIGCIMFPILWCTFDFSFKFTQANIIMTILFFIAFINCIIITNEIIKMNKTLIEKNPFVMNNVKSMRNIALNIFIIGLYIFIKDRLKFGHQYFFVFHSDQYGPYCDMDFLIFIIIGIFMIILAEMFNQCIKIKQDHDLTI